MPSLVRLLGKGYILLPFIQDKNDSYSGKFLSRFMTNQNVIPGIAGGFELAV